MVDIRNQLEIDGLEWCPMQIDFMIIPQASASTKAGDKYKSVEDETLRNEIKWHANSMDLIHEN